MAICQGHAYHSPRPQHLDSHHVIPSAWDGPDVRSNLVSLCPTGHRNVHYLLDSYVRAHGEPSWVVRRSFGPGERALAARAWAAALASPGLYHPVLTS